ncbi:hypothetical protein PR202_ga30361 [Eleusine coracana subsp. coracana]|uniref:Uncharacterized protein n=1 Tax=Eleusine coracana subsp. coracana TaxID=191504 RepID=A0AAV5DNT0_ELECO|nr:hypothetical protein PR202_ga30361 [Eleusine coracana subsp. coracana]
MDNGGLTTRATTRTQPPTARATPARSPTTPRPSRVRNVPANDESSLRKGRRKTSQCRSPSTEGTNLSGFYKGGVLSGTWVRRS